MSATALATASASRKLLLLLLPFYLDRFLVDFAGARVARLWGGALLLATRAGGPVI